MIEYYFETLSLRTEEEAKALDSAAQTLAKIERMTDHPEDFADLPPHLIG